MRPPEVADGIFRLGTRWANFCLLVDGHEATLVDAGYPRYRPQITEALAGLGLALWGTLSPSIRAAPSLVDLETVDHRMPKPRAG